MKYFLLIIAGLYLGIAILVFIDQIIEWHDADNKWAGPIENMVIAPLLAAVAWPIFLFLKESI